MYSITSNKVNDPCNARGVIHGAPHDWLTEHITEQVGILRPKNIGIRLLVETKTILIVFEGPKGPREAALSMLVLRIYPQRTRYQLCA